MDAEFWLNKWRRREIGFHEGRPNAYLERFWPSLALPAGAQVLVPLCGKSVDLAWLAGQGLRVLGVELSELAVQEFFDEQGLPPTVDAVDGFRRFRAGAIEILCGDVFRLKAAMLPEVAAFYDRAALIALTAPQRASYVELLTRVLPPAVAGLLITLEYDADEAGPPFPVADAEVTRLYAGFDVQLLTEEAAPVLGGLRQRGVDRLVQRAYRLRRS